jgi:RNA-directed DNA polymerase
LSHERSYVAGAESFHSLEGNMCGTVRQGMRGAVALPGSKATSRAKGSYRNLGDLVSGRQALRERDGPHREGEEPKPMMHGHEKSDLAIVAMKPANKAEQPAAERSAGTPTAAESVERRAGTKGNAAEQSTHRTQGRERVSQALDCIRQVARERKKERFTALAHHIGIELLEEAFFELRKDAVAGIDGLTWEDYGADLERHLKDLHDRVQRGAYRALPSRRVYIAKADGRQRPLAVVALEDKIVQRAVVKLLNAIYEEDFLGFSYGFRPGRGAHDALDALCVGIDSRKVNFILDADIRSFFDEISQDWLIRFLQHRIGDKRIIRLIQKWLKAGILEDGIVTESDRGTGQGSVMAPRTQKITFGSRRRGVYATVRGTIA